ncbi:response regulator [Leptospira sp. GIMC2001]|uniref:response regulator n=1 Tax=Leptospira sp. GIMC2001 TaxID=1513297 RepID=UPI0023496F36|nr:response regulator [Leptospira sp. GIMC2001]WCL49819.1 response regulator [Leptospira sp. GIMC2001]
MGKINILVVEDEPVIGMNISHKLQRLGYNVIMVVTSGDEAYQVSSEKAPDLVVMDIHLEGNLDGVDTAQTLWKLFGTPIVFVTGNIDAETKLRAEEEWCYGYVAKPFKATELETAVSLALNRIFLDRFNKDNHSIIDSISYHPIAEVMDSNPEPFSLIRNRDEFLQDNERFSPIRLFQSLSYNNNNIEYIDMRVFISRITYLCLDRHFTAKDTLPDIEIEAESIQLSQEIALKIAILVSESVNNSLLYGFPGDKSGAKVHVKFGWNRNKDQLILKVKDNGVGLQATQLTNPFEDGIDSIPKGLGLVIAKSITKLLDGEFLLSGDNGTCVEFKIPYQSTHFK